MKKVMVILACLVILLITGTANADQLLVNPGFEDAMTGWTIGYGEIYSVDPNSHEGSFHARCFWDGSVGQKVEIIPGEGYALSGSAYVPGGGDAGGWGTYIAMDWLNEAENKISTAWSVGPNADSRGVWHDYASSSIIAPANAHYVNVSIGTWANSGVTPAAPTDFDAFSLEGTVVPEPASMLLLGTGLIGLFGIGRRKKS